MASGTKSLESLAEAESLKDLASTIEEQSDTALFARGGRLAVGEACAPVIIRFDSNKAGDSINKATLLASNKDSLIDLVQACQPTTFGKGGEDVYDESYRQAGKLDETSFSTSFSPYEAGMVDSIAQILRPGLVGSQIFPSTSIKAVLYKLNVSI